MSDNLRQSLRALLLVGAISLAYTYVGYAGGEAVAGGEGLIQKGLIALGQKVPEGYYNLELMLKSIARKGDVLLCGTCMDARGLADEDLAEGARWRRITCWCSELFKPGSNAKRHQTQGRTFQVLPHVK